MTAHDPQLHRPAKGFLHWLGIGSGEDDEARARGATPAAAPAARHDHPQQALLEEIGAFLNAHRLEVTAYTLAIAHDYLTGADHVLTRQIDKRIQKREPVTLEWLEELTHRPGRGEEEAQLKALMTKLETSIEEFGRTAKDAKSATTDYSSALEVHVGELSKVSKAGVVISELAQIARAMLIRTREIEQEMTRSELQTRSLKRSLDQARRSADHDHLTGLPNRRAFDGLFEYEVRAAMEAKEPLCIAFCDIDHFKAVNDTHGHDAGDRVLKVVAQTLARISNDKCHVARHGGEEFVILLRGTPLPEAWEMLDQARADMAERRLVNRSTDVPFGKVTFSGGLADVFAFEAPRDALKAADEALYRAKEEGRNRIVVAPRPGK